MLNQSKPGKAISISASLLAASTFFTSSQNLQAQSGLENPALPDLYFQLHPEVRWMDSEYKTIAIKSEEDLKHVINDKKRLITKVVITLNLKFEATEFYENVEEIADQVKSDWNKKKKELGIIAKDIKSEEDPYKKIAKLNEMIRQIEEFHSKVLAKQTGVLIFKAFDGKLEHKKTEKEYYNPKPKEPEKSDNLEDRKKQRRGSHGAGCLYT